MTTGSPKFMPASPQDGTSALVAEATLTQGRERGLVIEAVRHQRTSRVHLVPLPIRMTACGLRLGLAFDAVEEDEAVWPICSKCWVIVTGAAP